MRPFVVRHISHFNGELSFLGDKSIAHRSIILSALSKGKTLIKNFPANKDCLATLNAFQKLGIKILQKKTETRKLSSLSITVYGKGLYGLKKPAEPVYAAESGTTLRLLLGVLAGQNFEAKLSAGKSLSHRPMLRVTAPLRLMGAKIISKIKNANTAEEYPPIIIKGGRLKGITYKVPVPSAQVKSAILLAGLYAAGKTIVIEPLGTRDHTERMLKLFKADIKVNRNTIVMKGKKELVSPGRIILPGDLSSAAFFIALATIVPNSIITIKNVNLNPSRTGIIKILKKMGASINIKYQIPNNKYVEPVGDLVVKSRRLKGLTVKKEDIPFLIDELPILMVAASLAKGETILEGVQELRVKETDRIRSMSENLAKMGAKIRIHKAGLKENIIIKGVAALKGAKVKGFSDHRTAMSMVIAGLAARGRTSIHDISCINKSFPGFLRLLNTLKLKVC